MSNNNLTGTECKQCHYKTFPRRIFCPSCSGIEFNEWQVPNNGSVFSYTVVNFPLNKYEKAPYTVALIKVGDLEKKPLITARVKTSEVTIGQNVNLTLEKYEETGDRLILTATPMK